MLSINPETICFIIAKAREFHAKEEVVIPEEPNSPTDDWGLQVLADHLDDDSYREIHHAICDMEPDQYYELVALMLLGRGDYGVEEWDDIVREVQENWDAATVNNLIAIPLLADYLIEGLDLFDYRCDE